MFILPIIAQHFTLKQFKKHMRSAAGAVLLLQGDHVTGTHRTSVTFSARAQSNASQRSFCEGATIVREFEMRFWLQGLVVDSQAQVFCREVGVNNLMRI